MYYLRGRKGKSARISEKIKKKIGIDLSEKIVKADIVQDLTHEDDKTKTKESETKKEKK